MRIPTNKGLVRVLGRFYVVQFGDSLFNISQKFNISVADILAFNDQIVNNHVIFPGELLFIPNSALLSRKSKKRVGKKK